MDPINNANLKRKRVRNVLYCNQGIEASFAEHIIGRVQRDYKCTIVERQTEMEALIKSSTFITLRIFYKGNAQDPAQYELLRDQLLQYSSSSFIVLLEPSLLASIHKQHWYPIRGVFDIFNQKPKTIALGIRSLLLCGHNFDLISGFDEEIDIESYISKLPIDELDMLKMLPSIFTKMSETQTAKFFGISDRTLRNRVKKWCEVNGFSHREQLIFNASTLGWVTQKAIDHAQRLADDMYLER